MVSSISSSTHARQSHLQHQGNNPVWLELSSKSAKYSLLKSSTAHFPRIRDVPFQLLKEHLYREFNSISSRFSLNLSFQQNFMVTWLLIHTRFARHNNVDDSVDSLYFQTPSVPLHQDVKLDQSSRPEVPVKKCSRSVSLISRLVICLYIWLPCICLVTWGVVPTIFPECKVS